MRDLGPEQKGTTLAPNHSFNQKLATVIQRGNPASVMGTFGPGMARGGLVVL